MFINFDEEKHIYTDNSGKVYPSVTTILGHFGFSDFSFVNADVLARACERGTAFHEMTEAHDYGILPDDYQSPWLDTYRKFLKEVQPKILLIETPLGSIKGFAGTSDRVFLIDGHIVADYKTGALTPAHDIQCDAYAMLIQEEFGYKVKKNWVINFTENKYKINEFKTSKTNQSVFLGLVQAYKLKKMKGLIHD